MQRSDRTGSCRSAGGGGRKDTGQRKDHPSVVVKRKVSYRIELRGESFVMKNIPSEEPPGVVPAVVPWSSSYAFVNSRGASCLSISFAEKHSGYKVDFF